MSRYDEYPVPSIAQLLEELCPDGVPTVPLGGYAKRNRATNITAGQMAKLNTPDGDTLVFAAGSTKARINAQDHPGTHVTTLPSVIVKSRGYVDFEYCDEPFTHKAELWSYHSTCDDLNMKYLFYFLSSQKTYFQGLARANAVKLPQLKVADTDDFGIPLPPPEVQEQVVDILDMFTDLDAILNRELELREGVQRHYRLELLTDSALVVQEAALGSLVDVRDSLRKPVKKENRVTGPYPYWGANGVVDYVDDWLMDGEYVLVGEDSAPFYDQERDVAFWINEKFWPNNHIHVLEPKTDAINSKYLTHFLNIVDYEPFLNGQGRPKLNQGQMKRIPISYPNPDAQQQIVDTLDMFTDYTDNLRREIDLRRRQLEYYRGQLPTFPAAE